MLYPKIIIGTPVQPSAGIKTSVKEVYEIKLSHGGGIGGANYKLYGDIKGNLLSDEKVVLVDAYTNQEKIINTRFMVSANRVNFITTTCDATDWANYYEKKCNKETIVCLYAIPTYMEYGFKNKSNTDSEVNKKYLVEEIHLKE